MNMLKKYSLVVLFEVVSAAIAIVPVSVYAYVKFGFASECASTLTKSTVTVVFILFAAGVYLLSAFNRALRNISNWILRFVLRSLYLISLVAACVYMLDKLCETVNALAQSTLKSIEELTAAVVYSAILFLVCFVLSRAASFFAAFARSRIDDYETLKSTRRAERAIARAAERKRGKTKKPKRAEEYLDE